MDSKKKPLWLVFENHDEEADDVLIIFKNGDGKGIQVTVILADSR